MKMKIDWIKIGIARGWSRVVFCVTVSLLALFNGSAYAQKTTVKAVSSKDVLRAGDVISGVVNDSVGPLMMANVTERDSLNRIVAHATTDVGGNFSFKLVNPGDRIEFSYIGFETYDTLISADYYEVRMRENPATALIVSADKIRETTAYGAIPLRKEPYKARITIRENINFVVPDDLTKTSYTKREVAKLMNIKPRKIKSYTLLFDENNQPYALRVWTR